jgi:hypothetical protein
VVFDGEIHGLTSGWWGRRVLPVIPNGPDDPNFDLDKANAEANCADTIWRDENGVVVPEPPWSRERYDAWSKALDERIISATPSP